MERRNGVLCCFNSLGHIVTRQKPGTGKKFPSLPNSSKVSFSCLKGHRQPSTTRDIYIATRPTRLAIQRRLVPVNSRVGATVQAFNSCTSRPGVCQWLVVQPGGGGALGYLGGRIRSLSKLKNTPKALISGQKSTLILIKR